MTDEQIIKAVGVCKTGACRGCPYHVLGTAGCISILMKDVLDLINRQKAEIERLEKELTEYKLRLKMSECTVDEIKAEAYKEFVNRLKNSNEFYNRIRAIGNVDKMDSVVNCVDNLLKEMVGEEE